MVAAVVVAAAAGVAEVAGEVEAQMMAGEVAGEGEDHPERACYGHERYGQQTQAWCSAENGHHGDSGGGDRFRRCPEGCYPR